MTQRAIDEADDMRIIPGDFDDPRVLALLRLHLDGMHANSPPGSVNALDLCGLRTPDVNFLTAWHSDTLLGMGAIKEIDADTGEIKSMRTDPTHLGTGVGKAILEHLIGIAKARGYRRVSLETGSGPSFEPALALYRQRGFVVGNAFGDYTASAFNQFLHLDLDPSVIKSDRQAARAGAVVRHGKIGGRGVTDAITLDRQARYRRRILLTTDGGREFLLDLPEATYLADGDGLQLDDGGVVLVKAAPEPLLEIHAHDAASLARIAWHIGNRHTPAEVTAGALYIQPDHVLEAMVIGLGAHVHHVVRPFEPEGGAYGHKGALVQGHSHGHEGHAHTHPHGDDQTHGHDHGGSHHAHDGAPGAASRKRPRVWRPE